MRMMVLGGAGFVGSGIARAGLASGVEVAIVVRPGTDLVRWRGGRGILTLLEADLVEPSAVRSVLQAWRPTAVVQAAFPSGHGAEEPARARAFVLAGVMPALALTQALAEVHFDGTLVHTGSAMSFGGSRSAHCADDRLAPTSRRGLAKACCALIYEQAARSSGFHLWELFVASVYGPWQQRERLVSQLLRAGLGGPRVGLTAHAVPRNWIHVDDVAAACMSACRSRPDSPTRVLVGHQVATTHQLAALLENLVGQRLVADTPYDGPDAYGDEHLGFDLEPGRAALGWEPRLTLEAGLERTWAWARGAAGRDYLLEDR